MKINNDSVAINRLLSRSTEEIFVKDSLEKKLKSGRVLRIKLGFDPTSPNIHLGRAIILRKLREFQNLGHKVVFIVGDFTAKIGDPSDKLEKRPMLSEKEIKNNIINYRKQIGKIIDLKKSEFKFNSKWLTKLSFKEIAELAECFSVQQMSKRRNFTERIEKGEEISLREFLYPLMQGYDSVEVKADVEIGGFDQLFNLKAGRIIQKHYNMAEQDIVACQMLEGTDGRKMSSSWKNVIGISDRPEDMYGKIMSLKDSLVEKYFKLCTDLSDEKITLIMKNLFYKNPRDAKMLLAKEIVKIYHGAKKAEEAEENFIKTFQKKETPSEAKIVKARKGTLISDILVSEKIVSSKSEFSRLIDGGAVEIIGQGKIADKKMLVKENISLKIGKYRFLKIVAI